MLPISDGSVFDQLKKLVDSEGTNLGGSDWLGMLAAIGIAVLSGLVAGFYPTWRVCRVQPAAYLKTQ